MTASTFAEIEFFLLRPESRRSASPALSLTPVEDPEREEREWVQMAQAIKLAKWDEVFSRYPKLVEAAQNGSVSEAKASLDAIVEVSPEKAFLLAIASLQCLMQANWTGPPLPPGSIFDPHVPSDAPESSSLKFVHELSIDGEELYERVHGAGLLWTSLSLFAATAGKFVTGQIWASRAMFAWQRLLAEATDRGSGQSFTLMNQVVEHYARSLGSSGYLKKEELAEIEKHFLSFSGEEEVELQGAARVTQLTWSTGFPSPSSLDLETKSSLVVELALRMEYYNVAANARRRAEDPIKVLISAACRLAGDFKFELTGVEGVKRKYQTQAFAQMATLTWSSSEGLLKEAVEEEEAVEEGVEGLFAGIEEEDEKDIGEGLVFRPDENQHRNIRIKETDPDTDILEKIRFTQEEGELKGGSLTAPLLAIEQAILLAEAMRRYYDSASDNDPLQLEMINALVQRALVLPKGWKSENWLVYSKSLWLRCKTEFHRTKTRARSCFQLQTLVDQFKDQDPEGAAPRLEWVHCLGYPARWSLQRELGRRMMEVGMVMSAHDMFVALRLWADAVDCLIIANRENQAKDLLTSHLDPLRPSPRLLCSLGDLTVDPSYWEQAWEVSGKRYARAQRSIGRYSLKSGNLSAACEAFSLALQLNPLHPEVWFSLGCCQMKLENFEEAKRAFARFLGIRSDDGQAWANLAACHSSLDSVHEARHCIGEAVKHAREMWKVWDSFLTICVKVGDLSGVLQGLKHMAGPLEKVDSLDMNLLKCSILAVVRIRQDREAGKEAEGEHRILEGQAGDLLELLTSKKSTEPAFWGLKALFVEAGDGGSGEVLGLRMKQIRGLQTKLWEAKSKEEWEQAVEAVGEWQEGLRRAVAGGAFDASVTSSQLVMTLKNLARKIQIKFQENKAILGESEGAENVEEIVRVCALIVDEINSVSAIQE